MRPPNKSDISLFCIGGNEPQFSARLAVCFESGWPLRNSITWGRPLRSLHRPRRRLRLLIWVPGAAEWPKPGGQARPTNLSFPMWSIRSSIFLPPLRAGYLSARSSPQRSCLPTPSRAARGAIPDVPARARNGDNSPIAPRCGHESSGHGYCLYAIRCCEMSSAAAFSSGMNFLNSAFGEWRARFVDRLMAAMVLPLAP